LQRRDFLKLLGGTAFLPLVPGISIAAVPSTHWSRTLILVELKGGNDGLNTVIPYADPLYARLRPRLAIPHEQILQLTEDTGLHPALKPLLPLWNNHEIAFIQGVGYPDPNLSHFRSIEIWETASNSREYLESGWLARAFQQSPPPNSFAADAVVVGDQGFGPFAGSDLRTIALADSERFLRQAGRLSVPEAQSRNPALQHILKVEEDIAQAANSLVLGDAPNVDFPQGAFGNALKTVARIVGGRTNAAAFKVSLGSFDTHSNQLPTQARLLGELAEGLAALRAALIENGRWQDTLIMTYAEFGRRVQENNSQGTDHGTANTHLVMGGKIQGGLYGKKPQLSQLENGNLVYGVDFRSLYGTVLQDWWGLDAGNALGKRFERISGMVA
jgi:uncharacterized protein (DUF1501 family)